MGAAGLAHRGRRAEAESDSPESQDSVPVSAAGSRILTRHLLLSQRSHHVPSPEAPTPAAAKLFRLAETPCLIAHSARRFCPGTLPGDTARTSLPRPTCSHRRVPGGPRGASRRLALPGHGADPRPRPRLARSHPHQASTSPRVLRVRSLSDFAVTHVHPPACDGCPDL